MMRLNATHIFMFAMLAAGILLSLNAAADSILQVNQNITLSGNLILPNNASHAAVLSAINSLGNTLFVTNSTIEPDAFTNQKSLSLVDQANVVLALASKGIPLSTQTLKVPYGTYLSQNKPIATGQQLNYTSISQASGQATLYNIIVNKTQPSCQINIDGARFNQPTNKEFYIHPPIFPNQKTYNLTGYFTCTQASGNPATINMSIILSNGTTLFVNSKTTNNTLSSFNFKIPTSINATFALSSSGNQNYTSLLIDPVTAPANVLYYVPYTLTNSQANPTNDPYQANIFVNSVAFSNYLNGQDTNAEWFYSNGILINSWLESGNSNTMANALYFLSINSLAANGLAGDHITVYYGIGAMSANFIDGVVTGQAANLNGICNGNNNGYGACDNGATVFPRLYQNFECPTGAPCGAPGGWTLSPDASSNGLIVTNGIQITGAANSNPVYIDSNANYAPNANEIIDTYGEYTSRAASGEGNMWFDGFGNAGSGTGNPLSWFAGGINLPAILFAGNIVTFNPQPLVSANQIWSLQWTSSTTVNAMWSNTLGTNRLGTYSMLHATTSAISSDKVETIGSNGGASMLGNNAIFFWTRIRSYPPNGVAPIVTNTALVSTSVAITASPNPPGVTNTILDVGQITTMNTLLTGGFGGYTTNWFWIAPNGINGGAINGNTVPFTISNSVPANAVLIFNAVSSNQVILQEGIPSNTNIATNTLNTITANNALGVWTINAVVLDGNGLGTNTLTTSANTFTLNPALTDATPTASNTLIDTGQISVLTSIASGGTPTLSYKWYTLAGTTAPTCTASNTIAGATSSTYTASPTSTNSYAYQVTDQATTPNVKCSAGVTVTTNPAITLVNLWGNPSSTSQGATSTITYSISGGSTPFSYNFLAYNGAASPTNLIASQIIASCSLTTNSVTFTFPNQANDIGSITIYANVVDSAPFTAGTTNLISTNTITITPYIPLNTPSLAQSAGTTIVATQTMTFTASNIANGASPYSINYIISNTGGQLIANQLYKGILGPTNTFTWTIPSFAAGNIVEANVVITDGASISAASANAPAFSITSPGGGGSGGGGGGGGSTPPPTLQNLTANLTIKPKPTPIPSAIQGTLQTQIEQFILTLYNTGFIISNDFVNVTIYYWWIVEVVLVLAGIYQYRRESRNLRLVRYYIATFTIAIFVAVLYIVTLAFTLS